MEYNFILSFCQIEYLIFSWIKRGKQFKLIKIIMSRNLYCNRPLEYRITIIFCRMITFSDINLRKCCS